MRFKQFPFALRLISLMPKRNNWLGNWVVLYDFKSTIKAAQSPKTRVTCEAHPSWTLLDRTPVTVLTNSLGPYGVCVCTRTALSRSPFRSRWIIHFGRAVCHRLDLDGYWWVYQSRSGDTGDSQTPGTVKRKITVTCRLDFCLWC